MENEDHGMMTDLGNGYFHCEICGHEVLLRNGKLRTVVEGNPSANHRGGTGGLTMDQPVILSEDIGKEVAEFFRELEGRNNAKR